MAASVARTCTGSQGQGASLGVAGDGDGRGPDDLAADAPPVTFQRGGGSLPAPRRSSWSHGRRWLERWG